jgi:Amt family ammonium transporter
VHCIGGIVGALLTGILANPALGGTGIFDYAAGKVADFDTAAQLLAQFKAVCLTLVWSGVGTIILLGIVRAVIGLRPATDQEREGLDLVDHGERAYNY